MDYFVMPSQFLETFGLTACESLLCGVPVIGNKKGGLEAFIDDRLNIQQQIGSHDGEKLATLLEYLSTQKLQKNDFSDMMNETKRRYSKETRYRQISSLFPTNNTIHIISDYTNYNGGGIETHIHDSITILQSHKHNIQLQGHQAPTGKRATLKKLSIMAKSRYNINDAYKVWNISSSTTIRWHSISRVIGRLPILIA